MANGHRGRGTVLVGRKLRTWSLLVVVNLLWAAQYPAYRVVADRVSVAALNFWTFVIATVVLLPALLRARRAPRPPGLAPPSTPSVDVLRFVWLSLLGLIPPSVVMAWGIEHSSASNAAILSLTVPVLMMLMGILMLHERPGRYVLLSLTLALLGTALISWDDIIAGNFTGPTLLGNIAVFLSGAGAAFYNAYCKKLLNQHRPVEVLVFGYLAAVLMCAAISLAVDKSPFFRVAQWPLSAWVGIAILGALVWGMAMLLWMWLLEQLELGQISVAVYMLPVFGLILSALTLGERIGTMQYIGGAIVLGSAYLSTAAPASVAAAEMEA